MLKNDLQTAHEVMANSILKVIQQDNDVKSKYVFNKGFKNYQILAESFKLIVNQNEDPVRALLGMKAAKAAMEESDLMFSNISKYFKNNGIIFGNKEVGVVWNLK